MQNPEFARFLSKLMGIVGSLGGNSSLVAQRLPIPQFPAWFNVLPLRTFRLKIVDDLPEGSQLFRDGNASGAWERFTVEASPPLGRMKKAKEGLSQLREWMEERCLDQDIPEQAVLDLIDKFLTETFWRTYSHPAIGFLKFAKEALSDCRRPRAAAMPKP